MALYPHATQHLVDRYRPGGSCCVDSSGQRRVVDHTAVSPATSLFSSMNVPGTATSHFYLAANGTVEQYVDTRFRSSAVLDGNDDCVTIESWDGFGDRWHEGDPVPGYTAEQLDALVDLHVWLCREHDIPAVQLPSSRPGTRGIGWHRQGIDGAFPASGRFAGRVDGGEVWSTTSGKPCPGDRKITQLVEHVIPEVRRRLGANPGVHQGVGGPTGDHRRRISLAAVVHAATVDPPAAGTPTSAPRAVRTVEDALVAEGLLAADLADGHYGTATVEAYAAWQRRCGFRGADADGTPGESSLKALADAHGFTVTR